MRIHYFQHVPFEGLGNIADWIESRGHCLSATRFYKNEAVPQLKDIDWLIVMGGPMGAGDENIYPWLTVEKRFLQQSIQTRKKVLGVCLGAQLIAAVLGAKVYPHTHKEIGWYTLSLTAEGIASSLLRGLPPQFDALHWHGDTFDLPAGAKHLAASAVCKNQAFSFGENILGLQFHLDLEKENAEQLIANCASELTDAPYIQTPGQMLAAENRFHEIQGRMELILDNFAAL